LIINTEDEGVEEDDNYYDELYGEEDYYDEMENP
jgi:hypothetical protein